MSVHDKTIRLLRLLLLGQLIEKTGVLWRVSTDRCHLDVKFICRFGFSIYEVIVNVVSLEKAEEYIDDLMNKIAWDIVKAYGHRQKTKHDWPEE